MLLRTPAFEERFRLAVRQVDVREEDRRRRRSDSAAFSEKGVGRIAVQSVESVHQTEVFGCKGQHVAQGGEHQFKVGGPTLALEPVEESSVSQDFGVTFPDGDDRIFWKRGCEPCPCPTCAIPQVEDRHARLERCRKEWKEAIDCPTRLVERPKPRVGLEVSAGPSGMDQAPVRGHGCAEIDLRARAGRRDGQVSERDAVDHREDDPAMRAVSAVHRRLERSITWSTTPHFPRDH